VHEAILLILIISLPRCLVFDALERNGLTSSAIRDYDDDDLPRLILKTYR
jgi:hypothetical protein